MSHKISYDPINKVWSGPQVPYPYGNDSLGEAAYKAMVQDLEHVCQISDDSGEIYTNERTLKAAISMANSLKIKGLKKGDVVIVLMHNHHYLLPTWLGCVFAGVLICPFSFTYSNIEKDLIDLVRQADPKMMITTYLDAVDLFKSVFKTLKIDCPIYTYDNKLSGCYDLKPLLEDNFTSFEEFRPASVSDPAKDVVVLILSSGTSGKPKFINGTHKTMLMQMLDNFYKMTITTAAVPGWQSEFIFMMGILVKTCCRIIRVKSNADELLHLLAKYKVQLIICKPMDIYQMVKSETIKKVDLSNLIIVMSTGNHLSIKLATEFQAYIPNGVCYSAYGNSEYGGGLSDASDMDPDIPNLVGKAKKNFHYCVIDEAGNRCGPNELGEICVRSDAPFGGYYKNEEKTKTSTTSDGFFLCGDMGYLDEDGNIFLIERIKHVVNHQGRSINQWDIERIIIEHVKGIASVCVVDVENDKYGVMPYIAIIPDKGVTLSEADVIKTVMKHYPFNFDTRVFFFEELPMTISGKYKKYLIRNMILEKLAK